MGEARNVVERFYQHGTAPDHRVRRRDVRNRTVQGTHRNDLATPLGTIVASDHPLDLFFTDYFRVASGKIVECEAVWDRLSIVAQLGASIGADVGHLQAS